MMEVMRRSVTICRRDRLVHRLTGGLIFFSLLWNGTAEVHGAKVWGGGEACGIA